MRLALIIVGFCTILLAVIVGFCSAVIAGNAADMSAFSKYGDDLSAVIAVLAVTAMLLFACGIATVVLAAARREAGRPVAPSPIA